MSVRLRLTLMYTSVLGALIIAFGIAVYSILDFNLNQGINQSMLDTADQVLSASRAISTEGGLTVVGIPPLDVFRTSSVYTQVWNVERDLVDQSDNLGDLRQSVDPQALAAGDRAMRDVTVGDAPVRVLTMPIEVNNQAIGYLQVAASLETMEQARENLLAVILTGGGIALVLSAISGYWIAARALHPVTVITDTARQIREADDLERRIPYNGPADELGQLVNTFNETLATLEKLFNAQERLVADVSHELRTPLTSIRGNIDLIRRMGNNADEESLAAIEDEAQRMARLVGDLLLLAQADAGRLSLIKETVELDTLLVSVHANARVLAGRRVDIRLSIDDRANVWGDPDRLKQLFLNLASNAIKYTDMGDTITITMRRVAAGADEDGVGWVEVAVTDSGPGIPPDELANIFERFYRVDHSRARADGGAGLGLSIANWIAKAHGGEVRVASKEGEGTTFTVRLPLLPDDISGLNTDILKSEDGLQSEKLA